jgi:hypothetical protein
VVEILTYCGQMKFFDRPISHTLLRTMGSAFASQENIVYFRITIDSKFSAQ